MQVFSDAGFTQIDGTLKNVRVIQYGTLNYQWQVGGWEFSFPDFGFVPIIMISPPQGFSDGPGGPFERSICEVRIERTYCRFSSWQIEELQAPGFPVDYAILAPMPDEVLDLPDYGLVIYDEAGKAVFSSAEKYMAIDMIHNMSTLFPGYQWYVDVALPNVPYGKRYFSIDFRAMQSTGNLQMSGFWYINPNLVRIGQFGWAYGVPSYGEPMQTITGYFNP